MIGINSMMLSQMGGPRGVSFAVPIDIRDQLLKNGRVVRGRVVVTVHVVECATGAATAGGIQPGDVVLGINNRRVASVKEPRDAVRSRSGGAVALLVERDGAQVFVPVPVGVCESMSARSSL